MSSDAIYAIGSKQATSPTGFATEETVVAGSGNPAYLQVSPTELSLEPGQTVKLHARSFDASGRFLREEKATWTLEGLEGTWLTVPSRSPTSRSSRRASSRQPLVD